MKKTILLLLLFVGFGYFSFSQESAMTAYFQKDKDILAISGTNSTAEFGLTATKQQMEQIIKMAMQYPQKYTFKSESIDGKEYNYYCIITFLHGEDYHYLHKTLLWFGIAYFKYNEVVHPINDMLDIFK
jgi:hypothetical protein